MACKHFSSILLSVKKEKKMSENLVKSLFENDYAPAERFKFDLSLAENPYGCSDNVKQAIIDGFQNLYHYPDKENLFLKRKIAQFYGLNNENLYIGTGVTGIIQDLCKVFVKSGQHVLMPESTFPGPIFGATIMGGGAVLLPFRNNFRIDFQSFVKNSNQNTAFIFFCNPNNPTGILEDTHEIISVAQQVKCPVIISEANIEYTGTNGLLENIHDIPDNIVILRSFSKIYGLASLRVGFAVANKELIKKLEVSINPFRISGLSELAAVVALDDQAHVHSTKNKIDLEKEFLVRELKSIGFDADISQGNTFIAKIPAVEEDARSLNEKLHQQNCSVIPCNQFSGIGNRYIRIAPRTHDINAKFIEALNRLY